MQVNFKHGIDVYALISYIESIGYHNEEGYVPSSEGFEYTTRSGSASMTLSHDGSGSYRGQRSLLFSHCVFSCLAREYLADGKLEFLEVKSREPNRHPLLYAGNCYMTSLRDEVRHKMGKSPAWLANFVQSVSPKDPTPSGCEKALGLIPFAPRTHVEKAIKNFSMRSDYDPDISQKIIEWMLDPTSFAAVV